MTRTLPLGSRTPSRVPRTVTSVSPTMKTVPAHSAASTSRVGRAAQSHDADDQVTRRASPRECAAKQHRAQDAYRGRPGDRPIIDCSLLGDTGALSGLTSGAPHHGGDPSSRVVVTWGRARTRSGGTHSRPVPQITNSGGDFDTNRALFRAFSWRIQLCSRRE